MSLSSGSKDWPKLRSKNRSRKRIWPKQQWRRKQAEAHARHPQINLTLTIGPAVQAAHIWNPWLKIYSESRPDCLARSRRNRRLVCSTQKQSYETLTIRVRRMSLRSRGSSQLKSTQRFTFATLIFLLYFMGGHAQDHPSSPWPPDVGSRYWSNPT